MTAYRNVTADSVVKRPVEREIADVFVRASDRVPGAKTPPEKRIRSGITIPFKDELRAIEAIVERACEYGTLEEIRDELCMVALLVNREIGEAIRRAEAKRATAGRRDD